MRRRLIVLGVFLFASAPAIADDSSAALGAGGLVLARSAEISMAAEELKLNPRDVWGTSTLGNDALSDIDPIGASVLPDIDTSRFAEEPLGATTKDPVNFVGFEIVENGRKEPFQTEQRAFYKGRDVTG